VSAFDDMVDAQFEDPNLGLDAIWRASGFGVGQSVRIRRRSPEAVVGLGGNQFDLNAMLIDVRLSEVSNPASGDTFAILGDDGDVAETVQVTGLSRIDARKLVRTCEVSSLAEDEPEDP
jgi:hypothetical protein